MSFMAFGRGAAFLGWGAASLLSSVVAHPVDDHKSSTHQNTVWIEQSYEDFIDGSLDDDGVQFYVSARGDIRAVNQYDFNQDGAVDLVFCNTHGTVEKPDALIYLGSEDGYSTGRVVPVPTDGSYYNLVQDLNGDEQPELVIINCENGTLSFPRSFIYWGGPEGYASTFRNEIQTYNPGRPVAADLNADGLADLVIPNGAYSRGATRLDDVGLRVHWGSDRGYDDYDVQTLGGKGVRCVAIGSFGHSAVPLGEPMTLVVGTDAGLVFYSPTPDSLKHLEPIGDVECSAVSQVVITDVNGDGVEDALLNHGRGASISLIEGTADGLVGQMPISMDVNGGSAIACQDIDKDGNPDLVIAGASESESIIYWGHPDGYTSDRAMTIPTTHANDVIASDINHDGHIDVLLSQHRDEVTSDVDTLVLWGTGGRDPGQRVHRLPGHGTLGIGVGDVNRDGLTDVVLTGRIAGDIRGQVPSYIYWNDGKGAFAADRRTSLITNDNYEAASADFNMDGFPDLVFAEQYETQGEIGKSHIYWGRESGYTQDDRTGLPTHGPLGVGVADLNRDGYLDILFGQLDRVPRDGYETPPHMSRIYWGGQAGFAVERITELPSPATGTPVMADLNRDGWIDIVFPNGLNNDGARIYWGGVEGYSEARSELICFERGFKCEVADLDENGWLDLIFIIRKKGLTNDTFSLVYWGGEDGFSEKRRLEIPTRGAGDASVADLNKDGRLDILMTNYASDLTRRLPLYIYWGSESGWSPVHHMELPADSGSGNLIADLNRDGYLDLAIACHRREGSTEYPGLPNTHLAESFIYMGSEKGFDQRQIIALPTIGVHGMLGVDAGHVYHRKPAWIYTSSVHELTEPALPVGVRWTAKTYEDASVEVQVRYAVSAEALATAPWIGDQGAGSWFERPGELDQGIIQNTGGVTYAQYRVRLSSKYNARYPVLEKVELLFH